MNTDGGKVSARRQADDRVPVILSRGVMVVADEAVERVRQSRIADDCDVISASEALAEMDE